MTGITGTVCQCCCHPQQKSCIFLWNLSKTKWCKYLQIKRERFEFWVFSLIVTLASNEGIHVTLFSFSWDWSLDPVSDYLILKITYSNLLMCRK